MCIGNYSFCSGNSNSLLFETTECVCQSGLGQALSFEADHFWAAEMARLAGVCAGHNWATLSPTWCHHVILLEFSNLQGLQGNFEIWLYK